MTTQEKETEALVRATTGQSWSNYPVIIAGFENRGIPSDQIKPRENIFTYAAWRALGRQVRKGEHGIRVCTFIKGERKTKPDPETGETKKEFFSKPCSTTVFHVSQTEPIAKRAS